MELMAISPFHGTDLIAPGSAADILGSRDSGTTHGHFTVRA